MDADLVLEGGGVKGIGLVGAHKVFYKGDWLHDWVADRLADVGVRTWGDLRITREDDPGSALEPERSYKLVVIVSDISDNRLLRLPWDYDRLGVSAGQVDEMPVADAVRASASIPFFFQ